MNWRWAGATPTEHASGPNVLRPSAPLPPFPVAAIMAVTFP